jgi:hypothetical protein
MIAIAHDYLIARFRMIYTHRGLVARCSHRRLGLYGARPAPPHMSGHGGQHAVDEGLCMYTIATGEGREGEERSTLDAVRHADRKQL